MGMGVYVSVQQRRLVKCVRALNCMMWRGKAVFFFFFFFFFFKAKKRKKKGM